MTKSHLTAVVLAFASCQVYEEHDTSTSLADRVVAARRRMHVRFVAAQGIQRAIALGDFERARVEARMIETQSEPDFLPEWRPYLEDIRRSAGRIATSGDIVTAASSTAQLGRDCARCHEATFAQIQFPRESAPVETAKLGSQMAGHEWAAARMWEGLIASSSERWNLGARTLAGSRLTMTAESGQLGIADAASRTKLLAGRALETGDPRDRAALYGDLLATCARCHATIRDRM